MKQTAPNRKLLARLATNWPGSRYQYLDTVVLTGCRRVRPGRPKPQPLGFGEADRLTVEGPLWADPTEDPAAVFMVHVPGEQRRRWRPVVSALIYGAVVG